jgi:hypothetical protein
MLNINFWVLFMNKKPFLILAAIFLLVYLSVYAVQETRWLWTMTFGDPNRWNRTLWAANDAIIPAWWRILYLIVWMLPVYTGGYSIALGANICWTARNGDYFQMQMAKRIVEAGLFAAFSATLAIFAGSISPKLVSWYNADGPLPLRFWTGQNLSILAAGLAIALLGWILKDAVALAQENKAFV